jgi:hypothetical protein
MKQTDETEDTDETAPPDAIYRVRVVRGADLGLDAGTIAEVIAEYDGKIDLRIEALDTVMAGVAADHSDLERVLPTAPRRRLVVTYDVTGWSDGEIDALTGEALAQGEASDGHPDSKTTTPHIIEED